MGGAVLIVDGLINLLSALGLISLVIKYYMNRERSLLERRTVFLLTLISAICAGRALSYLTDSLGAEKLLETFIFLMASLLPIAIVLMAEGLLRRHAPMGLKLTSAIGSLLLFTWTFFREDTQVLFNFALMAGQFVVIGWVAWIFLRRNVHELSLTENRFINGIGVIAIAVLPLLVTDMRDVFDWNIPRLGSLAGLLLAYALVRLSDKRRKIETFAEIMFMLCMDVLAAGCYGLLWSDLNGALLILPLFVAFHLFVVLMREILLHSDRVQDWLFGILSDCANIENVSSLQGLLKDKGSQTILALTEMDLADYDIPSLKALCSRHPFFIRSDLSRPQWKKDPAAQQLRYLLDSYQMNQVHSIGDQKRLCLVFLNSPSMGYRNPYQREMSVLRSFVSVLSRGAHESV